MGGISRTIVIFITIPAAIAPGYHDNVKWQYYGTAHPRQGEDTSIEGHTVSFTPLHLGRPALRNLLYGMFLFRQMAEG